MLTKDFKTLVLTLSGKLLRFAIYLMKDEEEARDVIQDVFLKLWQKRGTLSQVDNIEAFAMRMTRNKCYDMHRRKRFVPLDGQEQKGEHGNQPDLNEELELSENARIIGKLINGLPKLQQEIMRFRDIDQLSYDEISEVTGLNANAIRVNLSRARKKIKNELLKQHGYGIETNRTNTAKIL